MKFELVVLQNGAEGKRIPLASPVFKIGRGETCNLRPNSERVSREHAEFAIKDDTLQVRDLGSRNGTLVNGKPISESAVLARGDQVTVGPLTFAIAIEGSTVPEVKKTAVVEEKPKSGSPADEIAALLLGGDEKKIASEAPSVYSGETITIAAFRAGESQIPASSGITEAAKMDDQGFERQTEESEGESGEEEEVEDEFVDESNPFYQKKPKEQPVVEGPKKEMYKDTADAASAILRKLMERKSDD